MKTLKLGLASLAMFATVACSEGPSHQAVTLPGAEGLSFDQEQGLIEDVDLNKSVDSSHRIDGRSGYRSCPNYRMPAGHHDCWTAQELADYVECEEPWGRKNGVAVAPSRIGTMEIALIVNPYLNGQDRNLGDDPELFRRAFENSCPAPELDFSGCYNRTIQLCRPYCVENPKAPGCAENLSAQFR
jgi:hypothetical protein